MIKTLGLNQFFTTLMVGLIFMFSANSYGQLQEAFQESNEAFKKGNRILAVEVLRKLAEKHPQFRGPFLQSTPLISDYSITYRLSKSRISKPKNQQQLDLLRKASKKIQRHPAIDKIVQLAKERRIVILNEAHDMSQHRAFGMQLALELKKHGFTHVAMEALSTPFGFSGPIRIEYPKLSTGHYISDPIFADFVRQVNRSGLKMVSYEIEESQRKKENQGNLAKSILERENAQSDNIIKHILKADPKSKVFIYVGYDHATENWQEMNGIKVGWLAAQLKKKTGIDPLTLDQVGGSYNPKLPYVDPVFQFLSNAKAIKKPILATIDEIPIVSDRYFGKIDWTVFHPPHAITNGRPNWLTIGGYRKPYRLKNSDFFQGKKTLVQAFCVEEKRKAIPMDQVLVNNKTGESVLMLPSGKYRIVCSTVEQNKDTGKVIEVK